ncbi:FkbM family methyltransferase [bacterium]|nr:FkbM family methyltransferase [bacterium]
MMLLKSFVKAIADPKYAFYILANRYIQSYENFSYEFEENGENELLKRLSEFNPKVIFDVGANVGSWTKIASKFCINSDFHCFEMVPETFSTLSKNLNKKNIYLSNVGLSDSKSTVDYKYYGAEVGVNKLETRSVFHDHYMSSEIRTTKVIRGDDYCKDKGIGAIDFLKIDVEGAELFVLRGFESLIKQQKIKVIQFEYGYTNGDSGCLMRDFYDFLMANGYVIGPLKQSGVWFMNFEYGLNNFRSGPNFVAVLESERSIKDALSHKKIKGYPFT